MVPNINGTYQLGHNICINATYFCAPFLLPYFTYVFETFSKKQQQILGDLLLFEGLLKYC
jgi:hypothetical protein